MKQESSPSDYCGLNKNQEQDEEKGEKVLRITGPQNFDLQIDVHQGQVTIEDLTLASSFILSW